jgi:beta-galactosidase
LNLAKTYLGEDVVYYTTDGNGESYFGGGRTDGALTTVDFGPVDDPAHSFSDLQAFFPDYKGPYVNSEYYTGWFAHWLEPFQRFSPEKLARQLDVYLRSNSSSFSVNMYMFLGGTTFGFYPGANANGDGSDYKSDPNTYDYDSPLTENGGCGVKCGLVREVILNHTTRVGVPEMPANISSAAYGLIQVGFVDRCVPVTEISSLRHAHLQWY